MASCEFIEEFDTDDEDVNTQSATDIVPQKEFGLRAGGQIQYQNIPYSAPANFYTFPIPTSSMSVQTHENVHTVRKRKRRKKRILLSDFSTAMKTYAWQKFQEISMQKTQKSPSSSLVEMCPTEAQTKTPTSKIPLPRPESVSISHSSSPQDDSNIRKLINKFKSQTAKRARQKRAKLERKAFRSKKSLEIDKWQIGQRNTFNKQREQDALAKDAKISLADITKKKILLQDKIKLITSLEKLREVRRKQLINVKAGFSSDSVKSSKDFQQGISSLRQQVETMLHNVTKEEEMIALMAQPQCQYGEYQGKASEKFEKSEAEEKRVRRERKWQKYLYKKTLKSQGLVSHV